MSCLDTFQTLSTFSVNGQAHACFSLKKLEQRLGTDLSRLPVSIRILLENLLRNEDGRLVTRDHIEALSRWSPETGEKTEIPFKPGRVLMQDFTGVPAVVDLAAMRDALARQGGDPSKINPRIPVHLVVDHSVQVDYYGSQSAATVNADMEMSRNRERYTFLKWGQASFDNFYVVPPATGICHQVNLEYLAPVVVTAPEDGRLLACPDTLVGLDSHTTMINGLGVLGWGVGGIEAEAVMLGQPVCLMPPRVIGFELTGRLPEGVTASDLVLTITQITREKGVVGSFIEFFGSGVDRLSVPDRATIANMTPEFGATISLFSVDRQTLDYLTLTGRSAEQTALIRAYLSEQGLFRQADSPMPRFSDIISLDLSTVERCLAGPRRPHDRVTVGGLKKSFTEAFKTQIESGREKTGIERNGHHLEEIPPDRPHLCVHLDHGAVVIAAITSCTNTSNPSVLLGAGLLARNAVARGLQVKPWVKTSLAPGSTVVTDYLRNAGLMPYLEALRFHPVAYGCTTCIGNSGALIPGVEKAVTEAGLVAASVLSGNRNYEGRVNPLTRANFLASPMLVIAYALAGTVNIDLDSEPLAYDPNNQPVFLRDIWPDSGQIQEMMSSLSPDMFRRRYSDVYKGDHNWRQLLEIRQERYAWDEHSTYIKEPSFFVDMSPAAFAPEDIFSARVLALLGDTITTDHISPAGSIPDKSPAGRYLAANGVARGNFNSYGARRGNHEVMIRGTFGNIRLKNLLAPGTEGGVTIFLPTGETMSIYEAAMAYRRAGEPLIVLAGRDYGSGSSRDWAAKGTMLLGVRAVIAESFERIHRSNLVAMGVLPLQFLPGASASALGLTGHEVFTITGIGQGLVPGRLLTVQAGQKGAEPKFFNVVARVDSGMEVDYYRHGGILPYVLRQMMNEGVR